MKNHANLEASEISTASITPISVAIVGETKERVTHVMDESDSALYDYENAEGVTDVGTELTDEQYRDVLDGKARFTHEGILYYPKTKKTFHGVSVEAERERLRNAKKLAKIADFLAVQ